MARKAKSAAGKSVESLRHQEAKRRNIPTAEYQSVIQKEAEQRGKDEQDWSDLIVQASPLYIQEPRGERRVWAIRLTLAVLDGHLGLAKRSRG